MDVVMLALARWDGPYSSTAFSLAQELSKSRRVFYVENPITIKYFLANIHKRQIWQRIKALLFGISPYRFPDTQNPNLIAVIPQLTWPINFLPNGLLYERLSAVNDRIVGRILHRLINDNLINRFIFLNCFNPFYIRKFPTGFLPTLFIYMTVDDIRHSTHIKKHGPRLEQEAMQRADFVLATSKELTSLASKYAKRTYYLPNAADISLFKTSHLNLFRPSELDGIDSPVIIYTGNIDHRIDFNLLNEVVQRNPTLTFVMVGPISINEDELQTLRSSVNVLFVGRKNLTDLPAWLKFAQCAIIPFKCNVLTKSIYPLKINEYLAAGKPVVSTPFSDDIEAFSRVIAIRDSPETFSDAINVQINIDSEDKVLQRHDFVENNTWKARVDLFSEIVKSHLNME